MRIWIDGTKVLDDWSDPQRGDFSFGRVLAADTHRVIVDYYEATGSAAAHLGWAKVATVPTAAAAVSAVAGTLRATVSWAAPGSDGGAPISGYMVTAAPGGKTCTTTGLNCVVGDLANGTPYTFPVVAANAAEPRWARPPHHRSR